MRRRLFSYLMVIVPMCILLPLNCAPAAVEDAQGEEVLTGVFYGVEGLGYETRTLSGMTNSNGEFQYRPGETVTFSVGHLVLGSVPGGNERVTPAHLVLGVNGDLKKLKIPKATNMARFLHSVDEDDNVENGITITSGIGDAIEPYKRKIDFNLSETDFGADPSVGALFVDLNKTLRSPAQARNHLRRTLYSIRKQTDVKIPMRDGAYVLGDIFRPIDEGKYPAIVSIGSYGKAPYRGCICNEEELLEKEVTEDMYFEGNPENHPYENHEAADAWYWVPKGYAVVRADNRGLCNTPGVLNPYGVQEAEDFYDSIEWIAKREWSNGNIGTWGASLFGINQWSVAQLQPPSLKAMISSAGDSDRYRQVVFSGGISNEIARGGWWNNSVKPYRCLDQESIDRVEILRNHPFYDPAVYGTYDDKPPGEMAADLNKIIVPFRSEAPLTHTGHQHTRGAIESYIGAASEHKQLTVITGDFIRGWMYSEAALPGHVEFFDYWLKGIKNQAMERPEVQMMMRTGDGGWFWQYEDEYPIARTEYRKYYLDATPSNFAGDGNRNDFMKLSPTVPTKEATRAYSAEVNVETKVFPGGSYDVNVDPCWTPGVSFVTEPLTEDMELVGYINFGMWVSSTSSDMDIYASVRVIDENNEEVPYAMAPGRGYYPVSKGWLKVSHRKLDEQKSTIYRPYHTHLEADYAPLTSPTEVVEVQVEFEPTTAVVKRGHRIRLDVQPVDGCGHGTPHVYDATYHQGASNTIYTGPDHPSWLQLPVIPAKTMSSTSP